MRHIELLNEVEVGQVLLKLDALEPNWSFIVQEQLAVLGYPYWLLRHADLQCLQDANDILQTNFGWLLERLRSRLEEELKAPVEYPKEHALPGFHMFFVEKANAHVPNTSIHWDYRTFQRMKLWEPPLPDNMDEALCISFTLPIELPAAGAGLLYWPNCRGDYLERIEREYGSYELAEKYVAATEPRGYEAYVRNRPVDGDLKRRPSSLG